MTSWRRPPPGYRRTTWPGWSTWSSTPRVVPRSRRRPGTLAAKPEPQNRFAIVLDGVVISAPSVSSAIPGGRAQIEGNFNQQSATELANVLKYGALPLAFDVSEVSNVSATLGGEQLRAGIIAGIIGLALVVLFCFAYYRGLGIVVVVLAGGRRAAHLRLHRASRQLRGLRAEPAGHRRDDRRNRGDRRQLRHLLRTDPRRGAGGTQPADGGGNRVAAAPGRPS